MFMKDGFIVECRYKNMILDYMSMPCTILVSFLKEILFLSMCCHVATVSVLHKASFYCFLEQPNNDSN